MLIVSRNRTSGLSRRDKKTEEVYTQGKSTPLLILRTPTAI